MGMVQQYDFSMVAYVLTAAVAVRVCQNHGEEKNQKHEEGRRGCWKKVESGVGPTLRDPPLTDGTLGQGILLRASKQLTLQAFSDSDWASCPLTKRSVTGYLLLSGDSPISWKSKKQGTVSKSSSEAEYRAMSQAASENTWLVRLL